MKTWLGNETVKDISPVPFVWCGVATVWDRLQRLYFMSAFDRTAEDWQETGGEWRGMTWCSKGPQVGLCRSEDTASVYEVHALPNEPPPYFSFRRPRQLGCFAWALKPTQSRENSIVWQQMYTVIFFLNCRIGVHPETGCLQRRKASMSPHHEANLCNHCFSIPNYLCYEPFCLISGIAAVY